jgi:hypothetical protein|nr:MAG TPA: Protein of unknown function (DUF1642) [Caudoviricetes sp.]
MTRQETISREEAVRIISRISGGSVSYAEDLYDSFFPKPVVPQYVADWYEVHKDELEINLYREVCQTEKKYNCGVLTDFQEWLISGKTSPFSVLVNMHQFGYEVEKETKYTVRIKVTNQYLCNDEGNLHFSPGFRMDFTKNDLEKLNLGWVFDCPGVEVKEVE